MGCDDLTKFQRPSLRRLAERMCLFVRLMDPPLHTRSDRLTVKLESARSAVVRPLGRDPLKNNRTETTIKCSIDTHTPSLSDRPLES